MAFLHCKLISCGCYIYLKDRREVSMLFILKKSGDNISDFSQSFDWVSHCNEGDVVGKRVGVRRWCEGHISDVRRGVGVNVFGRCCTRPSVQVHCSWPTDIRVRSACAAVLLEFWFLRFCIRTRLYRYEALFWNTSHSTVTVFVSQNIKILVWYVSPDVARFEWCTEFSSSAIVLVLLGVDSSFRHYVRIDQRSTQHYIRSVIVSMPRRIRSMIGTQGFR